MTDNHAQREDAADPSMKADGRPADSRLVDDPVLAAMRARRSISKVAPGAPTDQELLYILESVTPVADHKSLRPWRLLTLRGADRERLGAALDEAEGITRKAGEVNPKPLRADLLIALIAQHHPTPKVPQWEQHATAAGAAHLLELALWQAGWGVMWRSGVNCNATSVRALHGVHDSELLMGWLYVGTIPEGFRTKMATTRRPRPEPQQFLDTLPAHATASVPSSTSADSTSVDSSTPFDDAPSSSTP